MSKPIQLSFSQSWRERFKTPEYEYFSQGLPVDYTFSKFKPKYPLYVCVPMKSGQSGLFRLLDIETPNDPGDMHIPRWGFIKYLSIGEQMNV